MANLFNMDLGSFFSKKDATDANIDLESSELIKNTPVLTMKNNTNQNAPAPVAKNSINVQKPPIPTPIFSQKIPQTNPFNAHFQKEPAVTIPNPIRQNEFPKIPEPEKINFPENKEMQNIKIASFSAPPTLTQNRPSPAPIQIPPAFLQDEGDTSPKGISMKIFAIILSVLIIAVLAGGGYYLWTLQQKPSEEIIFPEEIILPEQPAIIPVEEPIAIPVEPIVPQNNPQYMNFNFQNYSTAQTLDALKKYVAEAMSSGKIKPIEFLVADMQNNPITFTDFSKKIGLTFSPEIKANLLETFSLFIYNDNGNSGVGLSIDAKNDTALKVALLAGEKNLVSALDPILLSKPVGEIDKNKIVFTDNSYKQIPVRYYNIISPLKLCIDYSVVNGKLLVGTTMQTLRAIYDYLEEEKTSLPTPSLTPIQPTVFPSST